MRDTLSPSPNPRPNARTTAPSIHTSTKILVKESLIDVGVPLLSEGASCVSSVLASPTSITLGGGCIQNGSVTELVHAVPVCRRPPLGFWSPSQCKVGRRGHSAPCSVIQVKSSPKGLFQKPVRFLFENKLDRQARPSFIKFNSYQENATVIKRNQISVIITSGRHCLSLW